MVGGLFNCERTVGFFIDVQPWATNAPEYSVPETSKILGSIINSEPFITILQYIIIIYYLVVGFNHFEKY